MCRRFSLDLDWDAVARDFGVDDDGIDATALPERTFRVEPRQTIGVVASGRDGKRHLSGGDWSLVPSWSESRELGYPTYNARMESAARKPTFRDAMRGSRAIIPTAGYFEFKGRRPFYFHASDDAPLAMAGLFSWWRAEAGAPWLLTATVLTCAAVGGAAEVHDRMPLLVPAGMTDAWLDRSVDGSEIIADVHRAGVPLSGDLDHYEVAEPAPGEDGPRCVAPLADSAPPRLF
ncbi:SOS response-associated peptidase [Bifidobacterium sp. ESL0763]|uniref:SOS response-associated peptidase n=1 Tax=Bifidobacterium sp. ESL0763 TaxID=2983227 RepID=UPI0023F6A43F|nr:SOS response-associated peptidase [Bifidobacterium sp. ESL0763]MDF7663753.1 SOS response-associated peptidase [Bifidobacterium sp. ESL0763]